MPSAVLLDIDDTLYDYAACDRIAFASLISWAREALGVEERSFIVAFGKGREITKQLNNGLAASHNRMLYCQKTLEILGLNPVKHALEMYDVYWDSVLGNMHPFDGVVDFFENMKKHGVKIGFCTDLTAHVQHRKLRMLGLVDYVDALVTSEEAGKEKPSPDMFVLCLRKLGISASDACYVGDSFSKDVIGAMNAGIFPVWFNRIGLKPPRIDVNFKSVVSYSQLKDSFDDIC